MGAVKRVKFTTTTTVNGAARIWNCGSVQQKLTIPIPERPQRQFYKNLSVNLCQVYKIPGKQFVSTKEEEAMKLFIFLVFCFIAVVHVRSLVKAREMFKKFLYHIVFRLRSAGWVEGSERTTQIVSSRGWRCGRDRS